MGSVVARDLVGRQREFERLHTLAEPSGPAAVAIVGEAGIGKTSLWEAAVCHFRAEGLDVRTARPAEAEEAFSFSALGDLLAEIGEPVLQSLPPPQRHALEAALLLRAGGEPPQAYAVAAAFLGTLRCLGERAPVVVAIDDLQWVDAASAEVLQYALRRAAPNEVRFLFALRDGEPAHIDLGRAAVEWVALERLTFGAIQHLISQRLDLRLTRTVAWRIHQSANGNPFFALELARAAAEGAVDDGLPLPPALLDVLGERLSKLPRIAERAVLAVALGADLALDRLADVVGAADSVESAVAAGALLVAAGRVRLSHPLIGSAVAGRSDAKTRRELSLRLAETSSDPEERVRHLALAIDAPNDHVAHELERAAALAEGRTALRAAADLTVEALRFAASRELEGRLLVAATERLVEAGDFAQAAEIGRRALAFHESGPDRARVLECMRSGTRGAEALAFADEALTHAVGDPALYARLLASRSGFLSIGDVAAIDEAAVGGLEALACAEAVGDEKLIAFATVEASYAVALRGQDIGPLLARMPRLDRRLYNEAERPYGLQAMWRGDVPRARALFEELVARARDAGEEWSEFVFLHHLLELAIRVGDVHALSAQIDEAEMHASWIGRSSSSWLRARVFLAAFRGEPEQADAFAERLRRENHRRWQLLEATRGRGLARLLAGDFAGAAAHLRKTADDVRAANVLEPGAFPFSADLVETLVGLGLRDEADRELRWLEDRAREQDHPWALAASARVRGLVLELDGDLGAAEASLSAALERHDDLELPLDEARARLALGRVLRRLRRRRDARAALGAATELLDSLGVVPLAAAAREELGRVGGRSESQGLTPAEERVARLAAEGLTNREIAERLVVSVRTVEANLTRAYAKLGVRSRVELARTLRSV